MARRAGALALLLLAILGPAAGASPVYLGVDVPANLGGADYLASQGESQLQIQSKRAPAAPTTARPPLAPPGRGQTRSQSCTDGRSGEGLRGEILPASLPTHRLSFQRMLEPTHPLAPR